MPPNLDESIEEVRFYIGQGMTEQAEQVLEKLEAVAPGAPELAILRRGIDSAKQLTGSPAMDQAVSLDETEIGESEIPEVARDTVEPAPVSHVTAHHPQPWPSERPVLDDVTSEIDLSLDAGIDDAPAHTQPTTAPVPPQATKKFSPGTLDEFVADLEASLGNDFIPEAPARNDPD